ncbi:MAG: hypothetical protein ACRC41_11395 [Sarcina sp.]
MKLSDRDILNKINESLETNSRLTLSQDKLLLQYLKKGKYKDYSVEDRKLIEKYVKLSDFLTFRESYEISKKKHDKISLTLAVITIVLFTLSSYIPRESYVFYGLIVIILILIILLGIEFNIFRKKLKELYNVHTEIWIENTK